MLGHEEADTLMSHLPPVTWIQVATKDDLDALGSTLGSEINTMGAELRAEMKTMGFELRTEMQVGVAGLRAEFVEGTNPFPW